MQNPMCNCHYNSFLTFMWLFAYFWCYTSLAAHLAMQLFDNNSVDYVLSVSYLILMCIWFCSNHQLFYFILCIICVCFLQVRVMVVLLGIGINRLNSVIFKQRFHSINIGNKLATLYWVYRAHSNLPYSTCLLDFCQSWRIWAWYFSFANQIS